VVLGGINNSPIQIEYTTFYYTHITSYREYLDTIRKIIE
jgi:hypothetical protein